MAPLQIVTLKAALHGGGRYRVLNTVQDLAEALLDHWPVPIDDDNTIYPAYPDLDPDIPVPAARFLARLACIAALEGSLPPEEARAAFVLACEEDGIHVLPPGA
jgi:hypothetical protein